MRVFLIRHGQSEANAKGFVSGDRETPLSKLGLEQAKEVGQKLKDRKFAAIYSSTLSRAFNTAEEIQKCVENPVSLKRLDSLRERDFGHWEGVTLEEIGRRYPEEMREYIAHGLNMNIPGGESVGALYNRVVPAYQSILAEHDDGEDTEICIVAHGCVLQTLFSYIMHGDSENLSKYAIKNARVNMVEYKHGRAELCMFNA